MKPVLLALLVAACSSPKPPRFGSHCDNYPWRGWVVGVSTAGQVTTLFSTMVGSSFGGGIWGSGGGLVSDGNGRIYLASAGTTVVTTSMSE